MKASFLNVIRNAVSIRVAAGENLTEVLLSYANLSEQERDLLRDEFTPKDSASPGESSGVARVIM